MKKEIRAAVYDDAIKIEAYRFEGVRPFPNHFHEYYVIGLVETGQRRLLCMNKEYTVSGGSVLLFNPGDSHACVQSDGGTLDYRGFNITKETMLQLAEEATGRRELPGFSSNVVNDEEVICHIRPLHEMIMNGKGDFEKEEMLLLLILTVIQKYGRPFESCMPECRQEIEKACEFIERHYSEHICLDEICRYAGLGKSTLLRAFTKSKGVTPYRYLENIRVNEAKKLLEKNVSPFDAAMQTGFSDQSHFTNYFSSFIGIAPGVYRDIFSGRKKEDKLYGK